MKNKTLSLVFVLMILFVLFVPLVFSAYIVPERRSSYSGSGDIGDYISQVLTTEIPFPYMVSERGDIGAVTVDVPWILVAMAFALILPVVIAATRILPFFHGEAYKSARIVFYIALTLMIFFVTPFISWLATLVTVVGWYGIIFGWLAAFVGLCVALFALFRNQNIKEAAGVGGAVKNWFSDFGSGLKKTSRRETRDYTKENKGFHNVESLFESDASLDKQELDLIHQLSSGVSKIPEVFHDSDTDNKSQVLRILDGMLSRLKRLEGLLREEGRLDSKEEKLLHDLRHREMKEMRENDSLQRRISDFEKLRNKIKNNSTLAANSKIMTLLNEVGRSIDDLQEKEKDLDSINKTESNNLKGLLSKEKEDSVKYELGVIDSLIKDAEAMAKQIKKNPKKAGQELSYFVNSTQHSLNELRQMEEKDIKLTQTEIENLRSMVRSIVRERREDLGINKQIKTVQEGLNDLERKVAEAEAKGL